MATAKEYAQWIVANTDKKDTPDFETVSRAYLEARQQETAFANRPPPETSFFTEAGRGLENLFSSSRTGIASLFGDENVAATEGLERQEEIASRYGDVGSFQDYLQTYEDRGLLPAIGEAIGDVPELIGGQVPIIGSVVAGGLAGTLAAGPVGGVVGATAALFPQFLGSNEERQAAEQIALGEEVDVDVSKAALAATGQSALEGLGTGIVLGKRVVKGILGIADEVADARLLTLAAREELVRRSERSLLASSVRTAGIGAAGEVPVEIAQQVIERAQAGLDVMSDEALKEYGDAAYAALIVGGGVAGPRGAIGTVRARRELGRVDDAARGAQEEELTVERETAREKQEAEQEALDLEAPLIAVDEERRAEEVGAQEAEQERLKRREERGQTSETPAVLVGTPEGEILTTPEQLDARDEFGGRETPTETSTTAIPNTAPELKAWGRTLGIGPTAALLRVDGALAGKDISDPAQAAEVKSILEAYIPNRSSSIIANVEEYLQRPEFAEAEVTEEVAAPEEIVTEEVAAPEEIVTEEVAAPEEIVTEEVAAPEEAALAQAADNEQAEASEEQEYANPIEKAKRDAEVDHSLGWGEEEITMAWRVLFYEQSPEVARAYIDRINELKNGAAETTPTEEVAAPEEVVTEEVTAAVDTGGPRALENAPNLDRQTIAALEKFKDVKAVAKGANPTAQQTISSLLQKFEPSSALQILAAEAAAETTEATGFTEPEYTGTKENAEKAIKFLKSKKANLGKKGLAAVSRAEKIVEQTQVDIETYKNRESATQKNRKELKEQIELTRKETREANKKRSQADQKLRVDEIMKENPDISEAGAIEQYNIEKQEYKALGDQVDNNVDELEQLTAGLEQVIKINNPEIGALFPMGRERQSDEIAAEVKNFEDAGGTIKKLPPQPTPSWAKQSFGAPIYKGKSFNQETADLIRKGNVNEIISALLYKQNRYVAKILRKIRSLNLKTSIVVGPLQEGRSGEYDAGTDTITISPEFGMNEGTIVHELGHAALARNIANPNLKISKQFVEFFEQIKGQMGGFYGGDNLQEFAAEYLGNAEFQALLKTIKAPRSDNAFMSILQAIAESFGFRRADKRAFKFISDLLDISSETSPPISEVLAMSTPIAALDAVGKVSQASKKATPKRLDNAFSALNKIPGSNKLQQLYKVIRYDNVVDMWGQALETAKKTGNPEDTTLRKGYNTLKELISALEIRLGNQDRMVNEANKNYKRYQKIQKQFPKDSETMGILAQDAKKAGVDLADPNSKNKYGNIKEYAGLARRYRAINSKVRDMFVEQRKIYDAMYTQYKAAMEGLLKDSPTALLAFKKDYENNRPLPGYVPSTRFGEFVLDFIKDGRRVVKQFESTRDRQAAIEGEGLVLAQDRENLKEGEYLLERRLENISYDSSKVPEGNFLIAAMDKFGQGAEAQASRDQLYQMYLSMFPASSINRNLMKYEGVDGASTDLTKVYSDNALKWAQKLPNIQTQVDISTAINEATSLAKQEDNKHVAAVAKNILDKEAFLRSPTYGKLAAGLTTTSFSMFLLGSVSSAVVNLTVLPMLVFPTLGSRFGTPAAFAAMAAATTHIGKSIRRDNINWGIDKEGKDTKYKDLYDLLDKHGQLQHTLHREVSEGAKVATAEYSGKKSKVMAFLAHPFSAAERYSRSMTAVASYELALKGGGPLNLNKMSKQEAMQYALKSVKDMNTSGTAVTAAPIMQGDMGRVFFTFKGFNMNATYVIGKAWNDVVRGQDPEVVRIARRQLLGVYATSAAIAGVGGMPFVGGALFLFQILASAIDDEDEYLNLKEDLRMGIGEVAYNGLFNSLTNLDIASRVQLANDVVFRDDPRSVAEIGIVRTALLTATGPMGSAAVNLERGIEEISDGNVYRGVEMVMPTFIRNFMRGGRYMFDGGAMTLNGDSVTTDLSAYSKVMQIAGFAPANLSDLYERRAFASRRDEFITQRKSSMLTAIFAARNARDYEAVRKLTLSLMELGREYPGLVNENTISRSINQREARLREDLNGLRLSTPGERLAREQYGLGED